MNPAAPVTYTNYRRSLSDSNKELQGSTWDCPKVAQWLLEEAEIRVEMRWNGNPVRPPVGMRAGEASHEWRTDYGRCQCAKPLPYLEPRK